LGMAVGNSLEVKEAIDVLQGKGPADLRDLVLALGAELLMSAQVAPDLVTAKQRLERLLETGAAFDKFVEFVAAQGGDPRCIYEPSLLPQSPQQLTLRAPVSGFVAAVDALVIGQSVARLGAGRIRQEDTIDYAAGIVLHRKLGDRVEAGEPLATLHGSTTNLLEKVAPMAQAAWKITPNQPVAEPLIAATLRP